NFPVTDHVHCFRNVHPKSLCENLPRRDTHVRKLTHLLSLDNSLGTHLTDRQHQPHETARVETQSGSGISQHSEHGDEFIHLKPVRAQQTNRIFQIRHLEGSLDSERLHLLQEFARVLSAPREGLECNLSLFESAGFLDDCTETCTDCSRSSGAEGDGSLRNAQAELTELTFGGSQAGNEGPVLQPEDGV